MSVLTPRSSASRRREYSSRAYVTRSSVRSSTSAPIVPARKRSGVVGGVDQPNGAAWCVVRGEHPTRTAGAGCAGDDAGEQPFNVLQRNSPGAKQLRRRTRTVDDRALDTDRARPSVEDDVTAGVEAISEVAEDVMGSGGAHGAEAVRRRCCQCHAAALEQPLGNRMCRHPQADGVASTGDLVDDAGRLRHDQREWSRPCCFGEHRRRLRDLAGPVCERVDRTQMHDQGVICGASLHLEDPRHRRRVRLRPQPGRRPSRSGSPPGRRSRWPRRPGRRRW